MTSRNTVTIAIVLVVLFGIIPFSSKAQSIGTEILELLKKNYSPQQALMARGVEVQQAYSYGRGVPVGYVDFVENEAYIMHSHQPEKAYRAVKSQPLFEMDTLITMADSRLVVLFKDQSHVTLNSFTKLIINRSHYEKEKSFRDSILGLIAGKARFIIRKIRGLTKENYKVETPLATLGIRGSDFMVSIVPESELIRPSSGFLERLGIVKTAHAAGSNMAVLVVTGEDTNLSLRWIGGGAVNLPSFSSSAAFSDRPPLPPVPLPPGGTNSLFNSLAPAPSIMKMPEIFE